MKLRRVMAGIAFALLAMPLFGADVSVSKFELYTRGSESSGALNLGTYGDIDLAFGGGYKFGGLLKLNIQNSDLSSVSSFAATNLTFREASLTLRQLFGAPLNLSYFVGYDDIFANGDAFPELFGATPFTTRYRGYLYFPSGPMYDGIYQVVGTGLKLSTPVVGKWFTSDLYLYQDASLGSGYYSSDLRALFNFSKFKIDSFIGASFPVSSFGIYRAGVLLYYDTGSGGQFFTEVGIPRYDPVNDAFNLNLFYLLFEPRLDFGSFAIIPTLFWHPEYYQDQPTNQVPTSNFNLDFRFGNPNENPTTGGFETELDYSTTASSQISTYVSPYLRLVASGIIWRFKVNVKVFPFSLSDLVEAFVGVQTQF